MLRPATPQTMMAALAILAILSACRDDRAADTPRLVSPGELADVCTSDSLRPAAAAPAQGLWLYERPSSRARVAARIGPPGPGGRGLDLTRPVESIEVDSAGAELRYRVEAATVALELVPPPGSLGPSGAGDSTGAVHPAATYAVSRFVRLAAYEPCITSTLGPRIRYLRRDAEGRVVVDVMLHRASDR